MDDQRTDEPLLVRASEAARILGIPEATLRRNSRAGRIPCHKLGRSMWWSPAELRAWATQPVPPRAAPEPLPRPFTPDLSLRRRRPRFEPPVAQTSERPPEGPSIMLRFDASRSRVPGARAPRQGKRQSGPPAP